TLSPSNEIKPARAHSESTQHCDCPRQKRPFRRRVMKTNSRFPRTIVAITLCSALLGLAEAVQAHECTLSDTAGRYGYTSTGTIVTPSVGPFTAVGHVTLTESGTFTGAQNTSIAGNLIAETIQGTYTVNADCTGSATASVYHGTTLART